MCRRFIVEVRGTKGGRPDRLSYTVELDNGETITVEPEDLRAVSTSVAIDRGSRVAQQSHVEAKGLWNQFDC